MPEQKAKNKVMIVDDDSSIRSTVKTLLELEGIAVSAVPGGIACLEELERGFSGVILLDIMMPQMDGWDTLREIVDKGLMEGNVISMLTAKETPGDKMEGLEQFVTDYITKPFDTPRLLSAVTEYMSYLN